MKTVPEIQSAIKKAVQAGLNVLLEGDHGVGKSSILFGVARDLGLQMKYFSASTLDPFADLVGVPLPMTDGRTPCLLYLRPDSIQQAEVMFFDEFNRAHPKVLNAVFEIIQFHTINGEPLPRLRCVVAAINPASAGYQVEELDPALMDRFPIHLRLAFGPDRQWFIAQFGERMGRALVDWYETDLDDKQRASLSNRRLEYIGRALVAGIDAADALPTALTAPTHLLQARLREEEGITIELLLADPDRFSALVKTDLNIALRFVQLLPMMRPAQMNRVRDIVLALPDEMFAQLRAKAPFVFKRIREAATRDSGSADAAALGELLDERLAGVKV
jgi:hypothetical protein